MVKYPIKDHQVAAKQTAMPTVHRTHACYFYRKESYGHCNRDLENYLAFYCSGCKCWYCGICYALSNKNRDLDEACPGKCGTVTSAEQIVSREWFPAREQQRLALTPVTPLSQSAGNVSISTAIAPTLASLASPPPSVSLAPQTPLVPQDPWLSAISRLSEIYSETTQENKELKRKLQECQDYKSKYESLKKKVAILLEESN